MYIETTNKKAPKAISEYESGIYLFNLVPAQAEKKQTTIKQKLIMEANYDDLTLQPGEDREFKNQFTEFLQKNMVIDEPVKKKKTTKKKSKTTLEYFINEDSATE